MVQSEFVAYDALEQSHWWFAGRRRILASLLRLIPEVPKKSLLEVGCGTGGNLLYLFYPFAEKKGLEVNATALHYARQKLGKNVEIFQHDANHLESIQKKFDCIAFCDVLYHDKIKDLDKVIAASYSLLNRNGFILCTDGAFNFLSGKHSESVESARRFTRSELIDLFQRNNFHVRRATYWGVLLFFLIFLKRKIVDRLASNEASERSEYASPIFLSQFLKYYLFWEAWLLRFVNLPFGASVMILAQKGD